MFAQIKQYTGAALVALALVSQLACNKIPEVEEITPSVPSGQSIAEIIETDANYSILKAAATKAGVMDLLGNKGNKLTLFAPNNEAMLRSGISEAAVGALPAAQLKAILSYHLIPQAIPSSAIPGLPAWNVQMPTLLQPTAEPLFKLSTFPSKRGAMAFVNNIPITAVDKAAANGYIHDVYALVAPPQATLKGLIAADPDLTFFRAAIARADEGSSGLSRLDSLLNYPFPNITVFAPTDDAFKALLAYLKLPADPAVFAMLPVQTVRGIVAYHFLGTNGVPTARLFSPNLVNGTYETLIGPAPMPPITIDLSNPALPIIHGAVWLVKGNIIATDKHGVNGVYHKINQVLLPQNPG